MRLQIGAIALSPDFPGWLAPLHLNPVRLAEFVSFSSTLTLTWVGCALVLGGYAGSATADVPTALRRTCAAWLCSMPVAAAQLVLLTAAEDGALVGSAGFATALPLAASGPGEPFATAAGVLGEAPGGEGAGGGRLSAGACPSETHSRRHWCHAACAVLLGAALDAASQDAPAMPQAMRRSTHPAPLPLTPPTHRPSAATGVMCAWRAYYTTFLCISNFWEDRRQQLLQLAESAAAAAVLSAAGCLALAALTWEAREGSVRSALDSLAAAWPYTPLP
jgi:hypothetical protein